MAFTKNRTTLLLVLHSATLISATLISATLPGCGNASSELPEASPAISRLTTAAVSKAPQALPPPSVEKSNPAKKEVGKTPAFVPPYPERSNLFKLPAVTTVGRRTMSGGTSVNLRGFVSVDGIQALLEVNGELGAFREGEETRGVLVVQITPPNVILQRGRARWTATLFEGG